MKISDQLRNIASLLDAGALDTDGVGGGGGGELLIEPGHTLLEVGPDLPEFVSGVCPADYWVRGHIGCMKGARLEDWSTAHMVGSMMASGHFPLHLLTVAPRELGPPGATGTQLLASVADAGWVNGRDYRPTKPPGQNYADYLQAGRPSANAGGRYDGRGEIAVEGFFSPGGKPKG